MTKTEVEMNRAKILYCIDFLMRSLNDENELDTWFALGVPDGTLEEAGDLTLQKTDDRSRLEEAFRLIDSFMSQNVGDGSNFQIIMVEHADPEYWKNLSYFETRYVFTENRDYGLIPKYVVE